MSDSPRAFHFANAQIGSISSRADKSIGFRVQTGEMGPEQMAAFFPIQGQNAEILIKPLDAAAEPPVEVKSELEQKTMGQRVRGALFILHGQLGKPGSFEEFYRAKMQVFLDSIKAKLDN